MAASRARFMEKVPVFVRGLYGTTARRTGDLQTFSLNKCVVIDVFYEVSCRIPQELIGAASITGHERFECLPFYEFPSLENFYFCSFYGG